MTSGCAGFAAFACSSSWVICLLSGAVAAYAPPTEAPGHQKSDNQAHVSVSFDGLDLVFFVVNQWAGVVFCFDLFSRKRGQVQRLA